MATEQHISNPSLPTQVWGGWRTIKFQEKRQTSLKKLWVGLKMRGEEEGPTLPQSLSLWSHWNQEPDTCGRDSSEKGEGGPAMCTATPAETPAGAAAKPKRWGDLCTNRTSPGSASANINMDSPRDRFNQFM